MTMDLPKIDQAGEFAGIHLMHWPIIILGIMFLGLLLMLSAPSLRPPLQCTACCDNVDLAPLHPFARLSDPVAWDFMGLRRRRVPGG